jgi:N-acetylglucosamine-6-phosphate deacetylase
VDLVDLHLHGAFGVDVLTAEESALDTLSGELAARGVAGFLPTLVPVAATELPPIVARLSRWIRSRRAGDGRGALPLGVHFEGPFVSPRRCGALHQDALLHADARALDAFLEAARDVPGRPMMTIAPEVPGAVGAIRRLVAKGWLLSIGHTEADAATLDEALAAGARHMTHFGNAMRPLHHREPGPVDWGLATPGVTLDVIGDLTHLSASMLRLVLRAKGAANVALVSDAVPPAGLPDGTYDVWGETLTLKGGEVRNAAAALAGSACLLPTAIERLAAAGFALDEMRRCASEVPARILAG